MCVVLWLAAAVLALAGGGQARAAGSPGSVAPRAVPEGGKADQSLPPAIARPPAVRAKSAANATSGSLQAFVLTSSPDSFADLQAHAGAIGAIYPTYFQCASPSGVVAGAPDPQLDAYAAAHDLAELPRFSCQDGATVHRILTEPRTRARTLARLVALDTGVDTPAGADAPAGTDALAGTDAPAGAAGYAGLNLDLENDGARDRGALSAFVAVLAARLHAAGRKLAVDVDGVLREDPRRATYLYDDRALGAAADTVFVMAWGIHWERSGPGPLAPLAYVQGVARRLAGLPHARRFVLGVPMYGLDWAGRGGPARPATALQYSGVIALARSVGATPARDPASGEMTFAYARARVTHHVWYLDARAIAQRIAIARRYGLGAGVWRLGEEDQEIWDAPGI
jgi:spore germination protein YaaH